MSAESEAFHSIMDHIRLYEDGFDAFLNDVQCNPYNIDDAPQMYHAWGLGWSDAQAQHHMEEDTEP